jgi:SAM-dependent methyltransferase
MTSSTAVPSTFEQSLATTPPPHPARIAGISAGILMLELAFIRIVPSEVRAVAYFTNLILMASFFGLGTGCILSRRRNLGGLLPVGLVLLLTFIWFARGLVIFEEARQVHYWLQYSDLPQLAPRLPLFPAAVLVFVLVALPFVALGQALALEMDRHPRLTAYGWDIAGSLVGTIAFSLSALARVPPWVWPPLVATAAAFGYARRPLAKVAIVLAGLSFLLLARSPFASLWSPYYYVQTRPNPIGMEVWVNSTFLQLALDYKNPDPGIQASLQRTWQKWSLPYDVYRSLHGGRSPRRVLVLGAGTGNDVNVALGNGAESVVAVEIDPVVLELGIARNTLKPYSNPAVVAIVDDARHYLHASRETFDLVVFGTIDSVALIGTQANLRLENYVHTREALEDARRLLSDDGGLVAMYYSVFQPWMRPRVYATLKAAFHQDAAIYTTGDPFLFDTVLLGSKGTPSVHAEPAMAQFDGGTPSTDDWPFMYLERPTIAPVYLKLIATILALILGVFALLSRIEPARGFPAHFLLLGIGFTLLESSAIVRLSLLFGSTWSVNAVVFSSVLAMIFLANVTVIKQWAPPLGWTWLLLLVSLTVNWAFPYANLLQMGASVRARTSGLLIGLPVFCAALCFSALFQGEKATGFALGINLIGAMAGGLVEYLSMVIGLRAIWLLLVAVYAMAWLTSAARTPRPGPATA